MSNSKQIDYNKKNDYRYTTARSKFGNYHHTKNLSSKPTQEMIRFNKFLVKLCKDNGIDNVYEYAGEDRKELQSLNDTLSRKLTMIGVTYKDLWHSEKKFKFDKDGNVVDAWTGKIVRKRGPNGTD